MLNRFCLVWSVGFLALGVVFILWPGALKRLNTVLNYSWKPADQQLLRWRYLIGVVMLLLGYGMFRLAWLFRFVR